jgi:hypothetical protein
MARRILDLAEEQSDQEVVRFWKSYLEMILSGSKPIKLMPDSPNYRDIERDIEREVASLEAHDKGLRKLFSGEGISAADRRILLAMDKTLRAIFQKMDDLKRIKNLFPG